MEFEPPIGSEIKVVRDINSTSYIWKNGTKGISHYGAAAFIIFWLCGWTVGGFFSIGALHFGVSIPIEERLPMLAWFGAWFIGEVAAISILCFSLRPQKPSVLTLSAQHIRFETGRRPFDLGSQDTKKPVAFFKKTQKQDLRS